MDGQEVVALIGLIIAIAGFGWGIVLYLNNRMDSLNKDCHSRIGQMTAKTDFDRHVDHTERHLAEIRSAINKASDTADQAIERLGDKITVRLDNLMVLFAKGKGKGAND